MGAFLSVQAYVSTVYMYSRSLTLWHRVPCKNLELAPLCRTSPTGSLCTSVKREVFFQWHRFGSNTVI